MDGLVFTCQIGSLPATTFQVVDFSLQEGLSRLYHLSLNVVCALDNVVLNDQLGAYASLTILRNGKVERTVNGIVAGASQGNTDGRRTFYAFIIRPEMWRMTLNQDSRLFQRLSVPDILKQLLKEHRIKSGNKFYDDADHHPVREYTTQKRESAYDFWCRLAAEEGITFWFEEEQLFYSDSHLGMTAGLTLTYNAQHNTDDTDTTAWQWQYGEFLCPDEYIHKDYNYLRPSQPLQPKSVLPDGAGHSVFESYGCFPWSKEGQPLGDTRLNQLNSESKLGSANTNCIQLRPGKIFTLQSHPVATMNDRWQVVTVIHHGSQPQAAGITGEGTTLTNNVTLIPGRDDWRPPYRYKPMADGDELATVVGPEGEEIFVNEHGAIKVHFHWNRHDQPGDGSSCWVRVAQGWNGNGFGFMAIPRIGQEVIVSYLNGDIDRPIVTGCNYNGRNRPPLDLPAEKTRTTFKTHTHKGEGFNELRFEDAKGSEEVFIHAQKDMNTKVLNNRDTHVLANHSETVEKNQTIKVNRHKKETVKLTSNEIVGISRTLTVGAGYAITVGASMNTAVALSQTEQVGNHKSITVGNTLSINAGDVIELKCGKSTLRMDSAGRITIQGSEFKFEASGPVQIIGKDIDLN
ncbi:type VI secretion system tip protein TssI/VgrG [Xenorhabdus sp. XENO-10]|uniref:Type VI secretion system tip protein TssI/VgrG n=1 Tax=Xenorhabdus yunnanensis TaxID=3025878 RepID=A0ABT5LMH7_9GAMM|nr:type VI secretion system tip protein TssI/VgrG [Xenorhabdus yunnanensis]MDC9590970.1 type VI secretion system tip protein TssI/VgrG [Xenorhabdus yunnanensis]